MTGDVPYYGGRLTPAQAHAASHPNRPRPRPAPDPLVALRQLLDAGVITAQEYQDLRARVNR
ncbi:hypothetical protein ACTI_49790 [Actinoplanes sp. OR16]|nr:hypothetical protein ACTI_49790 [Actinoplanes sp. OR16]